MASLKERFRAFTNPEGLAKFVADQVKQKSTMGSFPAIFPNQAQGSSMNNNYSSTQQQMQSYTDWVYACERAIAEHVATIDFRLYVNRTATSSAVRGNKVMGNSAYFKQLQKRVVTIEKKALKDGREYRQKSVKPAIEELESHPILDLLHNPNPFMTKDEFFEILVMHMDLAGNAYIVKLRNKAGMPVALFPLNPQSVKIVPDERDFIKGYVYYPPSHGDPVPFDATEILHFKNTNPLNMYQGMSVVQAAARAIDTDAHAADYNRNFFYNSAQPAGVIQLADRISEDAYETLVDRWNDTYGGSSNAHKVAVLEQGSTYQEIGLSQKDMDFLNSREFNMKQILAIFRMPPSILGITTDVNRANAEAADYTFAKGVVRPKMMRICSRLTQSLAPDFDSKLLIAFTDPVPEDKEFMLKERQAGINSWRTIDETRALEGDEPLPNNAGAVMYLSNLLTPIDADIMPTSPLLNSGANNLEEIEEPEDLDEGNSNGNNNTNDTESDSTTGGGNSSGSASNNAKSFTITKKEMDETIASAIKSAFEAYKVQDAPIKKRLYEGDTERKSVGDKQTKDIDVLAIAAEKEFLKVSRKIFDAQKIRVLAAMSATKSFKKKDAAQLDQLVAALKESKGAWSAGLSPLYKDLMQKAGNAALAVVVGDQNFDPNTADVTDYISERGNIVGTAIDEETAKQLRATLTEGINTGEDYQMLSARVESVYGVAAGYRSDRISRTESINAANTASVDAWKQTDVVEAKEWYTSQDTHVCSWCAEMDGKVEQLDGNFWNQGDSMTVQNSKGVDQSMNFDFENIDTPPLHGNCRCVLLPVLK